MRFFKTKRFSVFTNLVNFDVLYAATLCFSVRFAVLRTPLTPPSIMAAPGAIIGVLDEDDYQLEKTGMKIPTYQSKSPLSVHRKFNGILESDTKRINAKL